MWRLRLNVKKGDEYTIGLFNLNPEPLYELIYFELQTGFKRIFLLQSCTKSTGILEADKSKEETEPNDFEARSRSHDSAVEL